MASSEKQTSTMADHQERKTNEGGATGESKKDSYGGGGRGRYGGGGRFERSSSYGGQRYDRDGRDRTHSASDRDGNGGNHNNSSGQQRQGPKRYQEQRRDWKKGKEKDKKKEEETTETDKKVDGKTSKERWTEERNERDRKDSYRRNYDRSDKYNDKYDKYKDRKDDKYKSDRKDERYNDRRESDNHRGDRRDAKQSKSDNSTGGGRRDNRGRGEGKDVDKSVQGDSGRDKDGGTGSGGTKAKSYQENRRSTKDRRKDEKRGTMEKETTVRSKSEKKEAGNENTNDCSEPKDGGAELMSLLNKNKDKAGGKVKVKDKAMKSKGGKAVSDLEAKWQKEEEQRRKKEEEEKKAEEERLKREEEERLAEEKRIKEEEERKKREEEEAARLREEEKRTVEEFIQEWQNRQEVKTSMRETNLHAADHRPDDSFFSKLDSSLKKNTAFVKKLKNLNELQKEALSKDFSGLNLTKYVGEAAAAITEAKLKMSDIQCALHLCSLLHQRYTDFAPALLENWQKVLVNKKDEKLSNPSKLRVDLRLFAELVAVGVFMDKEGLPVLANQLTCLTQNDKNEHNNLSIILSFCKHCGDDYAGLLPRKIRILGEKYEREIPRNTFLPPARQQACRNLLKEYYASLCKHVISDHKQLKNTEKQNRKILQTKGELTQDRKEKHEAAQTAFQKLLSNTAMFADLLDEDMPELPEDEKNEDDELMGLDVFNPLKAEYTYEGDSSLFEDDDTRMFYENLPDLKSIIPGILYKDSEQSGATGDTAGRDTQTDNADDEMTVEDLEAEMQAANELQSEGQGEVEVRDTSSKADEEAEHVLDELTPDIEDDADDTNQCLKMILDAFLQRLPTCVNRELIDKAAEDFCLNLNTKSNRRKLIRALFTVQRTRYDLLPFYSRLVATLHPCMPDVAEDLIYALKGDFRWHVKKKDQINIESKLKTVRFIGELVKFKMFPKSECLHCMKMLLFDFSHHNIEMACALLDSCGRFLYRSPDSHHRTKVYLDLMMRKKAALHLDGRYNTMIENAYYYCDPPEVSKEVKKERPPMHQYIRRLLYKDLSKITTEKVLRQMRKLNWDDDEVVAYAIKCLTAVWNMRYNSVHCMANLLAGLAPYHEEMAVEVIDNVLEDVRVGMEINHPKFNQRRVSSVKYLGELYNYRMVESSVIFKTLYSFITFGVSLDESVVSVLDPPEHLMRVRLTCVLLDTCGQYFDRGSSKKKLDCFLVYFQRYFWFKKNGVVWTAERPFPVDIEYLLRDTIENLRPKLHICENYEEALKEAEELDNEFKAKLATILPSLESGQDVHNKEEEEEDDDGRHAAGLHTITEEEETDDMNRSLSQVHLSGEPSQGDHVVSSQQNTEDSGTDRDATGSQSQPLELSADADMEDDDVMFSAGEDEEDDSFTVLSGGPKLIKCAEDEDFMSAFDTMLSETIQQRHQEAAKIPQADIAIPMHLKGQKGAKFVDVMNETLSPEDSSSIQFTVLTKKGNKPSTATLNIPITAEFATKFIEREEAERAEKEKMKRVVLDFHERQEEEDYQEMIASMNRPIAGNANRERRVRYQHPKGAPDADLIFGSKKR